MKEIPLPETREAREKKKRSLRRSGRFLGILTVALAALSIACLLGVFVAVIVAEFNRSVSTLCYYLAGGFGGGAVVFALFAVLSGKLSGRADTRKADFSERVCGEDSFFVGEGTLATFEEGRLRIHGEEEGTTEIFVPYSEIRVFSVCARALPCERGTWSVVLEIPRRYLMKEGAYKADDPPALVQTDAKERLFRTLEKYGLELIGEHRPPDMPATKRFKAQKKYFLPDVKKRRRALLAGAISLVLLAGGIPVAFLYNVAAGTMLAVFGVFLLARSAIAFVRARGMLAVFEEGVYWRDTERRESVFLKWEEIESMQKEEHKGVPIVTAHCAYGDYHFPAVADSYEFLREKRPEKFAEPIGEAR